MNTSRNNRTNKLFMAFAKGSDGNTTTSFKRYIGYAPVTVIALNPNKKELEEIYHTTMETDPVYIKEIESGKDKHKVKQIRLDFIVKTDPKRCVDKDGNPIEAITRVSFFLNNEYMFNADKTKLQVIDEYGRTAWVTQEEFKEKAIPIYSNGPANISNNYKAMLRGEEQLVDFCRALLAIPRINWWDKTQQKMMTHNDPKSCECSFEHLENIFKGDLSEIKEVLALQPNNSVYILWGIRNADGGRQYQTVFTDKFLSGKTQSFTAFSTVLNERKAAGAYPTSEFEVCPLKEYEVKPSDIPHEDDDDLPFGDNTAKSPWD